MKWWWSQLQKQKLVWYSCLLLKIKNSLWVKRSDYFDNNIKTNIHLLKKDGWNFCTTGLKEYFALHKQNTFFQMIDQLHASLIEWKYLKYQSLYYYFCIILCNKKEPVQWYKYIQTTWLHCLVSESYKTTSSSLPIHLKSIT